MRNMIRTMTAALVLTAMTAPSFARDKPFRLGLLRGKHASRAADAGCPDACQAGPGANTPAVQGNDPYGFAAIVNHFRARAGLPPIVHDPDLSSWAARNNVAQARRGIGHHVCPNVLQNCAWNTPDCRSAAQAWMESPGHRANMLSPSIRTFGIAYGPGPYWTMNAK